MIDPGYVKTHWARPIKPCESIHLTADINWDAVALRCGGTLVQEIEDEDMSRMGYIVVDGVRAFQGYWIVNIYGNISVYTSEEFELDFQFV